MNFVRWGMIGCGAVAETKSGPAYLLAPGSDLVAVASRRPSRAHAYADRHGVKRVFDDPMELIWSPDIDAVYIATPPSSHLALALAVAEAAKPCCVEKPMALCHEDADRMVSAFESAGCPLFVAYYRRSLPRFKLVKRWIAEGRIGQIRHVHWTLTRAPAEKDIAGRQWWRTNSDEAPGGYFDDIACQGLDLFDFLIGPIALARGVSQNQGALYQAPDAVAASWVHLNGATGTGLWNFAAFERSDVVQIVGSDGKIQFSMFEDAPLIIKSSSGQEVVEVENPQPIQLHHVENMTRHFSNLEAHPSSGRSAARTAWVMDQILDQCKRE